LYVTPLLCFVLVVPNLLSKDEAGSRDLIEKVYVDSAGLIHLVSNGIDKLAPKETDQVTCDRPKLAEDGKTAGWLVNYENCCTSYPVPLSLMIYRHGKIVRRFGSSLQSIWDWQFLKSGKQVAFWTGPVHGDFVPHFELHDIASGRLLAEWNGHVDDKHPAWVSGLRE
jgi:hypothetical protein